MVIMISRRIYDVIKWKLFRVTGPLCGEFTGPAEFPAQRPVTRSFDAFFDLRLNKRFSKQPWGWWFETPSWSLWRHCNVKPYFSYCCCVSGLACITYSSKLYIIQKHIARLTLVNISNMPWYVSIYHACFLYKTFPKWTHIGLWCGFHDNDSIVKCTDESNVDKINNINGVWSVVYHFEVILNQRSKFLNQFFTTPFSSYE